MPATDRPDGPMTRWTRVLESFTTQDEWGVRQLATALDLSPAVAHRILHDMERLDLVRSSGERGRFRVGPRLVRIAVLVGTRLDMTRVARPVLEATCAAVGETVVLALYSPERRQFWAADAAESGHTIRYIWESLREWSDLHLGSSGKGILAFLDPAERDAIVDALPDPIPGPTPIPKAALRRQLDEARERGFVVSHGERYAGAVGVSAPIRDATGRVVGDLIASWPDNRTDPAKEARVATVIVEACATLSRELGYRAGEA